MHEGVNQLATLYPLCFALPQTGINGELAIEWWGKVGDQGQGGGRAKSRRRADAAPPPTLVPLTDLALLSRCRRRVYILERGPGPRWGGGLNELWAAVQPRAAPTAVSGSPDQ
jgi:hypothetical protein